MIESFTSNVMTKPNVILVTETFSGDYTTLQFPSLSEHQLWDVIAAGTNKTALEGSFMSLAEGLTD